MEAPSNPALGADGKPLRQHYSNFLVTINTNYRPRTDAEANEIAHVLWQVADEFFQLEPILDACTFPSGGGVQLIDKVSVADWSIELGTDKRGQRVHSHALIKLVHHTVLRLSVPVIKAFFSERLMALDGRIHGVYCNVRWIPATEEMTLAYIRKGGNARYGASNPQ